MLKWLIQILIFFCMSCACAHAETYPSVQGTADEGAVHFAAHFGLAYAIQTVAYGISSRAFKMDKTDAIIFSSMLTLTGLAFRQAIESIETNVPAKDKLPGFLQGAAGVGASIGTCLVFDF